MQLTERKATILKKIVNIYTDTGEPVGSKALCDEGGMSLSSATIRNEMSDLAQMGLLEQPHTSSGRVPTEEGYRVYVNELMDRYSLSKPDREYVNSMFPRHVDTPDALLAKACNVLSEITNCASVSTTPFDPDSRVARIELLPVSRYAYVLTVMTTGGVMKSRMFRSYENIAVRKLETFAHCATSVLSSLPLTDIGAGAVQTVAAALGEDALSFSPVINETLRLIEDACNRSLITGGEIYLFSSGNYPLDRAKGIFNLISKGDELSQALSSSMGDTLVSIGSDNRCEALRKSSLITAGYSFRQGGGRIGIIGPVKLDYTHTIPIIEYVASVVDTILNDLTEDRRTQNVKS